MKLHQGKISKKNTHPLNLFFVAFLPLEGPGASRHFFGWLWLCSCRPQIRNCFSWAFLKETVTSSFTEANLFSHWFLSRWCWAVSVLISARCWVLIASRSLWCFCFVILTHACYHLKMSCFDMKQNEYQQKTDHPLKPSEIQLSQMFTSSSCFSPNLTVTHPVFFQPQKRQLPGAGVWGGHGQQRSGV